MPRIDIAATGNNIKKMMKKNGMTVKDMQTIFGFSTGQAIYKWLQGKCLPTIDNMVILAKIFNVKVDDILIMQ